MEEEELARQLAFLGASDDPEVRAQAQELIERLAARDQLAQARGAGSINSALPKILDRVGKFAARMAGPDSNLGRFYSQATDTFRLANIFNAQDSLLRSSTPSLQGVADLFDPQGAAERLVSRHTEPTQPSGDIQQQAASAAANQTIAGLVPGQGLGPDLQQQAAAGAANQAGALQAINQQAQLVSALQAGQLQGLVQQDELQRTQELLRLMKVPQADPNILNTAANFAQAPAVSTQPNNLTTLLPQQQQIGSVDLASLLPAAQTNINQRQRTARTEESFINANVREQERALELARQQYIDQVALGIFRRPR